MAAWHFRRLRNISLRSFACVGFVLGLLGVAPGCSTSKGQLDPALSKDAKSAGPSPSATSSSAETQDSSQASTGTTEESASSEQDDGEASESEPGAKFDLGALPEPEKKDSEGLRPCEIDFLFVVDNSVSMRKEQESLAKAVPQFIETLTNSKPELEKDYHIGVVTTDRFDQNPKECRFLGGLVTGVEVQVTNSEGILEWVRKDCGPYKSGLNYMTQEDDLRKTFTCAARPGIIGSSEERQIGALLGAVQADKGEKGQCNEGFVRDDALLVVVLISDEDAEHDTQEPEQWRKELLALKKNDPKRLMMVSIVAPPDHQCNEDEGVVNVANRIVDFTGLFGKRGFVGDICAPNYEGIFDKAVGMIDFACGEITEPAG